MPDWVEQLLYRFFTGHGLSVDATQLHQAYLRMELPRYGMLEVNFLAETESLLLSLRLDTHIDEDALKRALPLNHHSRIGLASPTVHMFDDDLVLRSSIERENINQVYLEASIDAFVDAHETIMGR